MRLNKQPLSTDEYQKLKDAKTVSKVDYNNKTVEQIPFNMIRAVECIIV